MRSENLVIAMEAEVRQRLELRAAEHGRTLQEEAAAILEAILGADAEADEKARRVPGALEGRVWIADDFDDPLPEDYLFEGRR